MECVQKASAHSGSFDSVQGGGKGIGPADQAQLDNAADGLHHHPARHLAYGRLPAVASPMEENHSKGRERKRPRYQQIKSFEQVTDTASGNNVVWRQCSEEATTRL